MDPWSRCSLPQLQQGGVTTQVMAVFTKTDIHSVDLLERQKQLLLGLIQNPSLPFVLDEQNQDDSGVISVLPAVENASGFVLDNEPLTRGLHRLDLWLQELPLFYVSFTWKQENRFGGGNATKIGLKPDGLVWLEALVERNIPIDLSHASDLLAEHILTEMARRNWDGMILASHSNFRSVHSHPRNLPDEFVEEIVRRNGVIGLNLIVPFLGNPPYDQFWNHVQYGIQRGWGRSLVIGADFFDDRETPKEAPDFLPHFAVGMDQASIYPQLFQNSPIGDSDRDGLMYQNGRAFIEQWKGQHVVGR